VGVNVEIGDESHGGIIALYGEQRNSISSF